MLRVAGTLLILSGCMGLGFYYKNRLFESIRHLRIMQNILEYFISEIRYGKATLHACLPLTAGRVEEPYKTALLAVEDALKEEDGRGFPGCWRQVMGELLSGLPVSKEERDMFLRPGECCGQWDGQMQIRMLEQYRDMLADAIRVREKNMTQQGKLTVSLGIMGGLLISVILL